MRFHSPDSFSPFAAGGINAYMYCGGDPVNRIDPSGHMFSNGSVKRSLSPSSSRPHSPSSKRSRNSDGVISKTLFEVIEEFTASLPDFPSTSAAAGSAGSSGHVVATISTGSSGSAGTTGNATFVRTSTNNHRIINDSTRRHLTDPSVKRRFQDFIQAVKPIRGVDGPKSRDFMLALFESLRDKTEITAEDRRKFGVTVSQKRNAGYRVHRWIKEEMESAGGNNVRLN